MMVTPTRAPLIFLAIISLSTGFQWTSFKYPRFTKRVDKKRSQDKCEEICEKDDGCVSAAWKFGERECHLFFMRYKYKGKFNAGVKTCEQENNENTSPTTTQNSTLCAAGSGIQSSNCTFEDHGEEFVQVNTYDPCTGLLTMKHPAHDVYAEATFFMSTKWNWFITCSENLNTAYPLETQPTEEDFLDMLGNCTELHEATHHYIEIVSSRMIPFGPGWPNDISPDTPIFESKMIEVPEEKYQEILKKKLSLPSSDLYKHGDGLYLDKAVRVKEEDDAALDIDNMF